MGSFSLGIFQLIVEEGTVARILSILQPLKNSQVQEMIFNILRPPEKGQTRGQPPRPRWEGTLLPATSSYQTQHT